MFFKHKRLSSAVAMTSPSRKRTAETSWKKQEMPRMGIKSASSQLARQLSHSFL
jgi:hypothetical protein